MTLLERLQSRTEITKSGCWLWQGYCNKSGYGHIGIGRRAVYKVHRLGYELLIGPIPNGLVLDHLCGVPACWNPSHLEPVTRRENTLRGVNPAARNSQKTHCINGHPLSGENLMNTSHPSNRRCLECNRQQVRAKKARTQRHTALIRQLQFNTDAGEAP